MQTKLEQWLEVASIQEGKVKVSVFVKYDDITKAVERYNGTRAMQDTGETVLYCSYKHKNISGTLCVNFDDEKVDVSTNSKIAIYYDIQRGSFTITGMDAEKVGEAISWFEAFLKELRVKYTVKKESLLEQWVYEDEGDFWQEERFEVPKLGDLVSWIYTDTDEVISKMLLKGKPDKSGKEWVYKYDGSGEIVYRPHGSPKIFIHHAKTGNWACGKWKGVTGGNFSSGDEGFNISVKWNPSKSVSDNHRAIRALGEWFIDILHKLGAYAVYLGVPPVDVKQKSKLNSEKGDFYISFDRKTFISKIVDKGVSHFSGTPGTRNCNTYTFKHTYGGKTSELVWELIDSNSEYGCDSTQCCLADGTRELSRREGIFLFDSRQREPKLSAEWTLSALKALGVGARLERHK